VRDRYPLEAYPSGLLRIDDTNNRFTQVQRESRVRLLSLRLAMSTATFPSVFFLSCAPAHLSFMTLMGYPILFAFVSLRGPLALYYNVLAKMGLAQYNSMGLCARCA